MIVSAVEVYPKECLGVLLGYRAWNSLDKTRRAIVEQAISYQTAERTGSSVEIEERHELRCKDILYKLSASEPIGYFHSHPKMGPDLSSKDKKSMNFGDIEIVVAISKKKRTTPWKYDIDKKELSGVFGDFRFDISASSCFKSKQNVKNFQRIELLCPFALGIGSKYYDVTVPFPIQ